MSDNRSIIRLQVIGRVSNEVKEKPAADYNWGELVSEIVIDPCLTEALDGLEDFSHIIVFWLMHKVDAAGQIALKVHPKGRRDLPLVGLFATRSPHRPNPLGKATVRLLERKGNILKVKGLDALDGTPVIDLKPYIPGYDSASGARVPSWIKRL
jgi:tRNA-Thr(GGU) m(6)t(6)A37 methyltransferase TsaA